MSRLRHTFLALSLLSLGSLGYAQDAAMAYLGEAANALPAAPPSVLPVGAFAWTGGDCAQPAPSCNTCVVEKGGCRYNRFGLFGELLYLNMRNADVPYAQAVDGLGDQALPVGPVGMAQPTYEPAYRFGLWFSPMELLTIRAQYLGYNSNTGSAITAPDGAILRSLTTHPNSLNNAEDSLQAQGSVDNDLRIIDLDAMVRLNDCGAFTLYGFGGLRYAELRQQFLGTYSILGETTVRTESDFHGMGPRFGLEGQVWVCGGLGAYGKGSANFLFGDFSAQYDQTNIFQNQLVNSNFEEARMVTNLELELGVSWTGLNDHVRVSAGYLISSWSNVISSNGLIQAVQQGDFTTNRDNLRQTVIFDGFVLHAEVRF